MFHRRFPSRKLSLYFLRKAYREAKIKKKKIRKTKLVRKEKQHKLQEEINAAHRQCVESREAGARIIYVDEMMTTINTMQTHEWSLPNQPFTYDPSKQ
jgi:hypothetical protein